MLLPVDIHFISVISNGVDLSSAGIDIGLPKGTPIVAVADGSVVYACEDMVVLRLDEPVAIDGQHCRFARYQNISPLSIHVDQAVNARVEAGRMIGRSGSNTNPSYLNFQLLTETKNGIAGSSIPKNNLYSFLWKDVAAAQTGAPALAR